MNEHERRIVRSFRALVESRTPVYKMIVFGSRARGEAAPDSDLDIVVVIDGTANEETADIVSDAAWEAGFSDGIVVVPIVYSRDEWENSPERYSLLVQAVEAEGVAA